MTKKPTILYHIPNPRGTGADRWIYEGWRDAFIDMGYDFFELTAFDDLSQKIQSINPDIFMSAVNLIDFERNISILREMRSKGTKFLLWVHWPLVKECEQAESYLLNEDLVDVFFGEREPQGMGDFEARTRKQYNVIANAANKKLHFPASPVEKYQYDIVYLGAKLPMKKWFFDEVLLPLTKKYKVGIFGPYWTVKDNILRAGSKLCGKVKFRYAADILNRRRILIPADEENLLYSSAKISLNFHEREADGSQPHYILNQRTFKIPACGGFQICDEVPAIRNYFEDNEVVTASYDAKDWFEKIYFYLNNEKERRMIQEKGTRRALKEHTYHNRVELLIKLCRTS